MLVNPLTYGVSALRALFSGGSVAGEPPLALSIGVMTAFAIAILVVDAMAVRRRRLQMT